MITPPLPLFLILLLVLDSLLRAVTQMIAEGKVKGAKAKQLQALLDPTPYILVHSQYWDRLPETLLRRRANILRALAE